MNVGEIGTVLLTATSGGLIADLARQAAEFCGFLCVSGACCGIHHRFEPAYTCNTCKRPVCSRDTCRTVCMLDRSDENTFCIECRDKMLRLIRRTDSRARPCHHFHPYGTLYACTGCIDPCPECAPREFYVLCGLAGRNVGCHFCGRVLCAIHRDTTSDLACHRVCSAAFCRELLAQVEDRCACGTAHCICSTRCPRCKAVYCMTCKKNGLHECGANGKVLGKRTRQ